MTVFEYLQAHPNATSAEIAKGLNKKTASIAGALSQLYGTGRIVKSGVRKGIPTYRVNDMPFGCSNSLTMMFNQLLNSARQGAAQKALNKQALREAAEKATAGKWVVELGDEVYAVDGNDSEQIAMVFSDNGRSDAVFIAAASPVAVLSLLDENLQLQRDKDSLEAVAIAMRDDMRDAREKLEAAEKRIAELSASHSKLRDTMTGIHNTIRMDGGYTPLAAILNAAKRAHEESATAAGIGVKEE